MILLHRDPNDARNRVPEYSRCLAATVGKLIASRPHLASD
jgi:hypothetical protein